MKETEVGQKLIEQTEQLELIAKELHWLLKVSNEQNVKPGTPLGEEFLQKFFSLYKDFQIVKQKAIDLANQIQAVKFTDRTMEMVYSQAADLLIRKTNEGIFEQFTSVAENGCLPDGTTFDDLSS